MKTLKLIAMGIMMLFASNSVNAQVSVNVNIGVPPVWAPVGQPSAEYYYIPDVQSYYDVRATQFIFLSNGVWIRSAHLPSHHRHYDLNRGYKVVLNDYHGSRPYTNYRHDKVKYYKGYNGHPRKVVVSDNHNHNNHNNHGNHNNKGNGNKGNKGNGHGNGNKHGH